MNNKYKKKFNINRKVLNNIILNKSAEKRSINISYSRNKEKHKKKKIII